MRLDVDHLARQLGPRPRSGAELEMARRRLASALPAGAAHAAWGPWLVATVATVAMAAAAVIAVAWVGAHGARTPSGAAARAAGPPPWPSWTLGERTAATGSVSLRAAWLRLRSGELRVDVPPGARATVITDRFVVTSTHGQFSISDRGVTSEVRITAGQVIIAASDQQWTRRAGETWTRVWEAPPIQLPSARPPPSAPPGKHEHERNLPGKPPSSSNAALGAWPRQALSTPSAREPGGDPTRAVSGDPGIAALRRARQLSQQDRHGAARDMYRRAATLLADGVMVEQATFWAAVSAHRAGHADADDVLAAFAARYPRSARRGQVALILGQRALGVGAREIARRWLEIARADPIAEVSSAARMLLDGLGSSKTHGQE